MTAARAGAAVGSDLLRVFLDRQHPDKEPSCSRDIPPDRGSPAWCSSSVISPSCL